MSDSELEYPSYIIVFTSLSQSYMYFCECKLVDTRMILPSFSDNSYPNQTQFYM